MDSLNSYKETIIKAVHLVWKSCPRWTLINFALVLILGFLPVAALYLTKLIIDTITASLTATDKTPYLNDVALLILVAAVVGILLLFSRSLSEVAREVQSIEVTDKVFDILHAQSIDVDLEYYDNPDYQNILHQAQNEAPYRPTQIVYSLVAIGQNGISLMGIAALIFYYYWWLGLILIIVALPAAIIRVKYSRKLYHYTKDRAESERGASYYHWILTDPAPAKEIRLFNIGPFLRDRFRSLRSNLRQGRLEIIWKRFINDFLAQSIATITLFGTLGFIAFQAVRGIVTIGDTVMYYMAFQSGLLFLQAILFATARLYEDHLFIKNFYQFLAIEPKIQRLEKPKPIPENFSKGVMFNNVSYVYQGKETPSVNQITLSIGPDEVIALVGENGSGKTTMIKLLCQLYNPTSGSITVDGTDIREFDPVEWRNRISVIFQDFMKYQMTALENISLGRVADSDQDISMIEEAARWSGADSVIRRLPVGYETMLGQWFHDGYELSHGEWQRIALARAFYRDAKIIVLDEPSSSLDAVTESKLFHEFREIIRGKSAVLISHRFSSVQIADRIYVVERGRIIEEGTHSTLMSKGGTYSRLFQEQTSKNADRGTDTFRDLV